MLAASGALSLSSLIAFLLYVFYLATPINFLISGARVLQQGLGAAGRIEEIRSMPIEEDVDGAVANAQPAGTPPRIDVRDLTFSYPDRSSALRGVSFTVPAGCQTAIVGLSGAGMTTLFSLLQRFYDLDGGSIRVDGVEITTLSRAELRRRIAYVEQDAPVLAGTIRDNLLYAAPDATPVEIARTLRATRLERFVHGLANGLDTTVGLRGITLSGGERQRLAIARRCYVARRCCCWTRRPPSSTPGTSRPSATSSPGWRSTAP
ncbi:ABC transporter ATP-binding protein [Micromonospora sp. M12]